MTTSAIRTIIKALPALAFLPPSDVGEGFEVIQYMADDLSEEKHEQVRPLLVYFAEVYVGTIDWRTSDQRIMNHRHK